jgi:hypothetical protein
VRKRIRWRLLFGDLPLIGTDRKETVLKVIFVLNRSTVETSGMEAKFHVFLTTVVL